MPSESGSLLPHKAPRALVTALSHQGLSNGLLELSVRTQDTDLNCREFSSFLALLDGIYGRLEPEGYRSYVQRRGDQLRIARIGQGSIVLTFLFNLLNQDEVWQAIVLYLILRTGPAILKGEVAKNWAEAAKAGVETYKMIKSRRAEDHTAVALAEQHAIDQPSSAIRLNRRQRKLLRQFIRDDPTLSGLHDRETRQVITVMERLLSDERYHLPASIRFAQHCVNEVSLRTRRKGGRT